MALSTTASVSAFGRHMKQWRRQSGLSQLELSVRAGLSQRHVSFIETGRSRPGEDVVHKVAEALEIPLRDRNSMLEAAGLSSSGLIGALRAKGLALVYGEAFRVWLGDDSKDMAKTMAALDRALRRAERIVCLCRPRGQNGAEGAEGAAREAASG